MAKKVAKKKGILDEIANEEFPHGGRVHWFKKISPAAQRAALEIRSALARGDNRVLKAGKTGAAKFLKKKFKIEAHICAITRWFREGEDCG